MSQHRKIKLLYYSDFSLAKTGFGRAAKDLLEYLNRTGRYEIIHACMMKPEGDPELDATPWKSIGTIPVNEQFQKMYQQDEKIRHIAGYGFYKIDEIIKNEKPDIILAAQDIWGIYLLCEKPYWNKIPSIFWTTLDSLPIHPKAIEASKKCQPGNFWVWSNFAEKDMKKNGHSNVQTVHAPFDDKDFHRMERVKKNELRKRHKINEDAFVIGFTFRNQLRKSIFCLLEGYNQFKKENPGINSKLLLHTSFSEGWNIMEQAKYYGVPAEDILTTYICENCREYEVKPFSGEKQNCRFCQSHNSQNTTHPKLGVSENQLCEIYNLMNVYCHPMNSGGLEIPNIEAKFCELPVLVTNYSCGEEICEDKDGTLPLEWTAYRDLQQSEFIKAATLSKSIVKQLNRVYRMDDKERREMGQKGREWAIERFSAEQAAKRIHELLLSQVLSEYDFEFKVDKPNPDAEIPYTEDDREWLKLMYKDILKMDVADDDSGLLSWLEKLEKSSQDEKPLVKQSIEAYFRQTARSQLAKTEKVNFETLLNQDDKGKRILFVLPQSIGDLYVSTSLFRSIKEQYPWASLYVATKPEYFSIFKGNPHVTKVLPYVPEMDNLFWSEGIGGHEGWFEICFLPNVNVQRVQNYQHNGLTKIAYPIYYQNDVS
jgi:glycosyltransferase involved in cell wall biosynthesis